MFEDFGIDLDETTIKEGIDESQCSGNILKKMKKQSTKTIHNALMISRVACYWILYTPRAKAR